MIKASLAQVRAGKNGRMVEIGQDVLDVCARIREVDRSLGVEWSDGRELFRIYELGVDGKKRTVMWTPELSADLPDVLRKLGKQDFAKEVDRLDAKAERDADHAHLEKFGPLHEKLKHAVRKDIGYKGTIYLPRGI